MKSSSLLQLAACALTVMGFVIPDAVKDNTRDLGAQLVQRRAKVKSRAVANGIPLRIEPLGASIVHGVASTSGDGFRKTLRDLLRVAGNLVDMVGSHPNGTMANNANEGWPGYTIDQITVKSASVGQYKPNLVLINAGTNDAIQNKDIPNVSTRMTAMLNNVWQLSPTATIVLSGLIPNGNTSAQSRGLEINRQYSAVATSLKEAGRRIVYFDTQNVPLGLTTADLAPDGTHPNDGGYVKFANLWFAAINQADAMGFIQPTEAVDGVPDNGPDDPIMPWSGI